MDKKSQVTNPALPSYAQAQEDPPPPMGYQVAPPLMDYQGAPAMGSPDPDKPGAYSSPGQVPPGSYQQGASSDGIAAVPPGPTPMVGTTTVVLKQNFGVTPASCNCPNCHQNVVTRTEYEVGLFAWLIAGIIFICAGFICCLCFIPFCVDSMKDVRHVCPNCNYTIHYIKRM